LALLFLILNHLSHACSNFVDILACISHIKIKQAVAYVIAISAKLCWCNIKVEIEINKPQAIIGPFQYNLMCLPIAKNINIAAQ
jgi:dihydroorotase